jgi:hypothetical protein
MPISRNAPVASATTRYPNKTRIAVPAARMALAAVEPAMLPTSGSLPKSTIALSAPPPIAAPMPSDIGISRLRWLEAGLTNTPSESSGDGK